MTLRVGFAGTPEFAATALQRLLDAAFTIPLVLTRPDKPKGRGLKVEHSAVKSVALAHGLALAQPASLRTGEALNLIRGRALDVLLVAAYGLILPQAVLDAPRHGCLNIHASLLPRWRGAAPIARAIEAGDAVSGVTLMQMDAGLDTGPMIARREVAIAPRDTAGTLHDRLAGEGAALAVEVLHALARDGALEATPQPAAGVTYAAKIEPADAAIDWRQDAQRIDRRIRAFDPVPGAYGHLGGRRVKVWQAEPLASDPRGVPPGTVLAAGREGIDVACGRGCLRIRVLQPAGSRRLDAAQAVAGRLVTPGAAFVASPVETIESRSGEGI